MGGCVCVFFGLAFFNHILYNEKYQIFLRTAAESCGRNPKERAEMTDGVRYGRIRLSGFAEEQLLVCRVFRV